VDDVERDEHGRPDPPFAGDEVGTILGFLEYQRATLEWKCRGLSDDELRRSLPPTSMTLSGMLKHLAYVEDSWFTEVVAGRPSPPPWNGPQMDADPDWDWHSAADDTGAQLRSLWAECVQRSRDAVAEELARGVEALGETHSAWGGRGRVSLRWVLVHMIEEYARHNGHADLLRESIDGETGE
jgi:uncharacterized damage-inducible protein DinB